MMTNEKDSIESIKKQLDKISEGQELILDLLNVGKGRKIRGERLKSVVKHYTEQGYSIAEISNIFNCSESAVSQKREQIKKEKEAEEEIDF